MPPRGIGARFMALGGGEAAARLPGATVYPRARHPCPTASSA
jgi:hypothetical protein